MDEAEEYFYVMKLFMGSEETLHETFVVTDGGGEDFIVTDGGGEDFDVEK